MAEILLTGNLSSVDAVSGFAATWLVQSTFLLSAGLAAGWLVRSTGAAVQSAIYRATLATALLCPLAAGFVGATGLSAYHPGL
ncbi:MAG: hypothetical protein H0T47_09065 [Planctomycetaceae bacterium]|nr:hypothetical protein [Planctomycetaceae bacterium]